MLQSQFPITTATTDAAMANAPLPALIVLFRRLDESMRARPFSCQLDSSATSTQVAIRYEAVDPLFRLATAADGIGKPPFVQVGSSMRSLQDFQIEVVHLPCPRCASSLFGLPDVNLAASCDPTANLATTVGILPYPK